MWQKREPVFSPRITGCRQMWRKGSKEGGKSGATGKGSTIYNQNAEESIKHYTHLFFLGERETQNHSRNITNHKTPSVFNYNQLREYVKWEGKQREGDMKEGPCDLEAH